MAYPNTLAWLKDSLQPTTGPACRRVGRDWTPLAGFSVCGCILTIYKDEKNYCAHGADFWSEEEPNLGYYDINLTWDELLVEIAATYDRIRARHK